MPGEGGHVDFAANTEEEDAVLQVMRGELGHVSAERFLRAPGSSISIAAWSNPMAASPNLCPKDITERALAGIASIAVAP